MKITLKIPSNAPGCFLIQAADGRNRLIQTDWDFPGVASSFGWSVAEVRNGRKTCEHSGTDGTIKCPDCGLLPRRFIEAARQWLQESDGAEEEDPGYFE